MDVKGYESTAERLVKTGNLTAKAREELKLYNATMKINRLRMLEANIGLHLVNGYSDLERMTGQKLTDETIAEYKRQAGILGNTVQDVETRAKNLVNQSFKNATWSERIWTNQTALKNTLSTELMKGLIGGKSSATIAANIRKQFGVSSMEAKRLARTELVRCRIGSQLDSYKENGWEEYEFLAYGSKSCEVCRQLDKKHFPLKDAMPAENVPPMHPNCRCSTAPYEDEEEYQRWLDSFGHPVNYARNVESAFLEPDLTNLKESIRFTKEDYIEELLLSQVGRDTIKAIEDGNATITISEEIPAARQRAEEYKGNVTLYSKMMESRRIAGQTLIHEMAHIRFAIGNCQHAEAICFSMEKMHIENRDWLTLEEWEKMKSLAKEAYSELEWEDNGYGDYRQFNFVKTDVGDEK